eukprot:2692247-Prymnesium_polylepis.2
MLQSPEPEIIFVPSGEKPTEFTTPPCALICSASSVSVDASVRTRTAVHTLEWTFERSPVVEYFECATQARTPKRQACDRPAALRNVHTKSSGRRVRVRASGWGAQARTVVVVECALVSVIFTLFVVSDAPRRTSIDAPVISKPPPVRQTFSRWSVPPSATSK